MSVEAMANAINAGLSGIDSNTASLATKAPLESPTFTGTVAGITKAMVGLGDADNTADMDKPLSDPQAVAIGAALAAREPLQVSVTQPEAEAGTETNIRRWSPLRVWQAISAKIAAMFCSQAEAEEGTNTSKLLNPYRAAQAITAKISSLLASELEAQTGVDTGKLMTPYRTAQAIAVLGGSGGGGGSTLVRGIGTLQGFTYGETPGVVEIVEVTIVDDVGASSHGKDFRLRTTGNEEVAVVMNCGAAIEVMEVSFSGMTGANFITNGEGVYIRHSWLGLDNIRVVWFNTGTESAPTGVSATAGFFVEVVIDPSASAEDITAAFAATGSGSITSSGVIATANDGQSGVRSEAPSSTHELIVITRTTVGRAEAGAVPGITSIIVPVTPADSAAIIASTIASACNGHGWSTNYGSSSVTFTSDSVGARSAPSSGTSGYSVTVFQYGVDFTPAGGDVSEVTLIPTQAGKRIKCIRAWSIGGDSGFSMSYELALKAGDAYYTLGTFNSSASYAVVEFQPASTDSLALWFAGNAINDSLVARITGSTPSGGAVTIGAITEQL
jgi:hypothetical protein